MKYRRKLDPNIDLAGATPEKLARALLRPGYKGPLTRHVGKTVATDEISVEDVASDHAGDSTPHLGKRV